MAEPTTLTVPLYQLAHGRTGDKGNRSNISVIAFHPQLWEPICAQVTEAAVAQLFADRQPRQVRRYLLPQLQAYNPAITADLNRLADIVRADEAFLDDAAETLYGSSSFPKTYRL